MADTRTTRRAFLKRGAAAGGGLIAGGALLGANGGAFAASSAGKAIRIGHPYPLTGPFASDGRQARQAVTLAAEELNAAGGIFGQKVEQTFVDVGDFAPDKIQAAFTRLVSQARVDAIITAYFFAPGPDMEI